MFPTNHALVQHGYDGNAREDTHEPIQKLQFGVEACIDQWMEMQRLQLDQLRASVEQLFLECTHATSDAGASEQNDEQQRNDTDASTRTDPLSPKHAPSVHDLHDLTTHHMGTKDIDHLVAVLGWTTTPASGGGRGRHLISRTLRGMISRLCASCDLDCCPWRRRMNVILHHNLFQYVVSFVICSNAFFIGVASQVEALNASRNFEARSRGELGSLASPRYFQTIDRCFCLFFIAELLFRFFAEALDFFLGEDKKWNWLDLALVITSIAQEFAESADFSFLRVFRVLRAVRIMRVVHVVKMFTGLRLILVAIIGAVMPLMWAFVFLLLVIYVFGIIIQDQVSNYIDSFDILPVITGDNLGDDAKAILAMQKFCPTLAMTLQSLFMSVTGGVSWIELWEPFQHMAWYLSCLYTLYIGFMVLGALNVVTGIFVEGAMKAAENDTDAVIHAEMEWKQSCFNTLKRLFLACDTDGSGTISFDEFKSQTQKAEVRDMFTALELDVLEAEGLFRLLDLRGLGEVSIEEFVVGCMRLKGHNKSINFASLMYEHKKTAEVLSELVQRIEKKLNMIYTPPLIRSLGPSPDALPDDIGSI